MTKRKYKSISYKNEPEGFILLLDGIAARTPLGAPYIMPNESLARTVCEEWRAQSETVRKETMPMTQIVSVALDLVAKRRAEVGADLILYSETDLVCYRAGDIPELKSMQARLDAVIAWAQKHLGMTLHVTEGIMPVKQPEENNKKLASVLEKYDHWKFAALAVAAKPLASVILALAFIEGFIDAKTAFEFAHLEETYETNKWGRDEEKDLRLKKLEEDVVMVGKYLSLL